MSNTQSSGFIEKWLSDAGESDLEEPILECLANSTTDSTLDETALLERLKELVQAAAEGGNDASD